MEFELPETTVALIEVRLGRRHHHHRAEYYPFIRGLVRALGWRCEWLVMRLDPDSRDTTGRGELDLRPEAEAALRQALEEVDAAAVVFPSRISERMAEGLHAARPSMRLVNAGRLRNRWGTAEVGPKTTVGGMLAELLGWPERRLKLAWGAQRFASFFGRGKGELKAGLDDALIDAAPPSFERRRIHGEPDTDRGQPVRLVTRVRCPYKRPVTRNRFYAHLDSRIVARHVGCAFCDKALADEHLSTPEDGGAAAIAHAMAQITAHQESEPGFPGPFHYSFEDSDLTIHLEAFFEALLARPVRPSIFTTMLRVDVLLARRALLEELLPRLGEAGHALELISIGAENFSPEENERLNKNITPEQLWECHAMFQGLERRFPEAFSVAERGYFVGILFTPWTRPEDIRINIEAGRRLGDDWFHRVLGNQLQLFDDAAITELARHDGLVADRLASGDDLAGWAIAKGNDREVPWRFADPRTATLQRILLRLGNLPGQGLFDEREALYQEVQAARAGLPEPLRGDYLGVARAVVDAVEALEPGVGVQAVFQRVREDASAAAAAAAAPGKSSGA